MSNSVGLRLEKYSLKRKEEVLIVNLETASGEADAVMIYAGFSSSLMKSTAFDPDIPVIAQDDKIISIDRLSSPYNPDNPQYIASEITWEAMENILQEVHI